MIRSRGHRVAPRSKVEIRNIACMWREWLAYGPYEDINPKIVIEQMLPRIMDQFEWDLVCPEDLEEEAVTFPTLKLIRIREDVWLGGHAGNHKYTLGHEIGHLALHLGQEPRYARENSIGTLPRYEDSEWQADQFSAELLMPFDVIADLNSPDEIVALYRVSRKAARIRLQKVQDELGRRTK